MEGTLRRIAPPVEIKLGRLRRCFTLVTAEAARQARGQETAPTRQTPSRTRTGRFATPRCVQIAHHPADRPPDSRPAPPDPSAIGGNAVGTFWAHLGTNQGNPREIQRMSFRCSQPYRPSGLVVLTVQS